jgi:hypothetical protein
MSLFANSESELNKYRGYLVNSACFSFGTICAGLGAAVSLSDVNDRMFNRFRWFLAITATTSALIPIYFSQKIKILEYEASRVKFKRDQL